MQLDIYFTDIITNHSVEIEIHVVQEKRNQLNHNMQTKCVAETCTTAKFKNKRCFTRLSSVSKNK